MSIIRPLSRLFQDLDNFTSYSFMDMENLILPLILPSRLSIPKLEKIDDDNSTVFLVELPGIDKNDISITLNSKNLNITAEKKQTLNNPERDEMVYGKINRNIYIGDESYIRDKISAEYTNGLLKITLPKNQDNMKLSQKIHIN